MKKDEGVVEGDMRNTPRIHPSPGTPEDFFGSLCKSEESGILRLAMSIVRSPDLAREVVQDTYLRLRTHGAPKDLRFPLAYLYKVATNCALQLLRRRKLETNVIQGSLGMDEVADEEASRPERQVMSEQILDQVLEVIAGLRDKEKKVLILGFIERMPREQLAREMGITLKALDLRTTRTMRKFRSRLEKRGIDLSNLER